MSRRSAIALSWSGGRDSALALRTLREESAVAPSVLLTTVTEGYERVSIHGVRRELVARQAEAAGLPLVEVPIPPACPNEVYEERMAAALATPPLDTVAEVAFGDVFLADVRAYREERLAAAGRAARFPLWGRPTAELARTAVTDGFRAYVVCLDPTRLDPAFAGRDYDERFLAGLPDGVDPCGENGEFHTFVHAAPVFAHPIPCRPGDVVERDGFVFSDLVYVRT